MNLNQMAFRCPDAEVVEPVRLEGYCLAFRMSGGGNGVATILPKEGSSLEGVLWRISKRDEQRLDRYEGFPYYQGSIWFRSCSYKERTSDQCCKWQHPFGLGMVRL